MLAGLAPPARRELVLRLTASPAVVRRMGQPHHPVVPRQGQPAARRPHPADRWASGLAVGGDELLVARESQFRAHLGPRHPYHEVCARRAIWCAHVSPPGPRSTPTTRW